MVSYNHKEIESKWQKFWEEQKLYATHIDSPKKKWYGLVEFPYPSGAGLHVGHVRSYTGMDIVARKRRSEGYEVLFPIGWDTFGLPAENYAIKTGIHPSITTKENVDTFRRQLKECGFSFDWDREVTTSDPEYYKWTQWIFLQMYLKGLAYKKKMLVNWCPKDKCVLANEEVVEGACERCGTVVEKKNKEQWMLGITKYAERLDKDLDETIYLDRIKIQQRNWIGMSEGGEIDFAIEAPLFETNQEKITVFTTRADTLFGCTYCVLAPEHAFVKKLLDSTSHTLLNKESVEKYVNDARLKKDIDRSAEGKEKTGVKLEGVFAINPATQEKLPVYIADYVLPHYGTGAIMAVPAHDERDYAFAKNYGIKIYEVIAHDSVIKEEIYTGEGTLINSGSFDGLTTVEAKIKITQSVGGRIVKKSKLRDWVFARQRYWGEPIPVVYDKEGVMHPVHASNLPIKLPQVDKFEPTENGESPLYQVPEWVNTKGYLDEEGFFHEDITKEEPFRRETDTMPQWAGSSWYFMRYIDPRNSTLLADKELLIKWAPIDWYNGGMEHTTLHLLYSRFWYKFLFDIGLVPTSEPYYKRTSQGMILGEGGVKMSKSIGNVVNPDEIVKQFGADTLRLYEMFIGPFDQAIAWNAQAVSGVRRFLDKVYSFKDKVQNRDTTLPITHQTIKKITEDIETMSFNTCVSQMMIWANTVEKDEIISSADFKLFLQVLSPFAPHIAEELWDTLRQQEETHVSIHGMSWPAYDALRLVTDEVTVAIQIAGKMRGTIVVKREMADIDLTSLVQKEDVYKKYVGDSIPKKIIVVKNKIVNIVI